MLRPVCLTALAGVFLSQALSQSPDAQSQYEGKPIASVVFDPPSQPLDPRDLQKTQVFKAGAPFHASDAAQAIDKLFATGYYDDVQIDVVPQGGQLAVRILTKNAWFVGHITIQGSVKDPPNRPEL